MLRQDPSSIYTIITYRRTKISEKCLFLFLFPRPSITTITETQRVGEVIPKKRLLSGHRFSCLYARGDSSVNFASGALRFGL